MCLSRGDLSSWERFVSYAQPLLNERDFWTRKVIGWVLREVSKKNPEKVFQFLKQNEEAVSGLTLREGAKYLPQESRSELGLRS